MQNASVYTEMKQGKPIFVVSGGVGASGELLVRTALAQFPDTNVQVTIRSHVHEAEQVDAAVAEATAHGAAIVHTLIRTDLRERLIMAAEQNQVVAIDLIGPIMQYLGEGLGMEPLGQPGLYRKLYSSYFRRIEAIEFTVAHDDGKRTSELGQADIILLGVSRVGKTPLSMYLAMQGWKVANVPVVPEIPLPDELLQADRRRVVALIIEPPQLLVHRRWRESNLGISNSKYVNRKHIAEELRAAHHQYESHGFQILDITDKPIETSGDEVITIVSR